MGWNFTAVYSNSFRAHQLGKTRNWVVIYFERDGEENQCTVVTEHSGQLAGRRVVRGREAECASHYARAAYESMVGGAEQDTAKEARSIETRIPA